VHISSIVENDSFGFPKVMWLQLTGKADKFISFDVKFSQDFIYENSLLIG